MTSIACIGGTTLDRRARSHAPLVRGTSNPATLTTTSGGVARNVADWLSQLGVGVALYSAVGDDRAGYDLLRELATKDIDVAGVIRSPDRPTATYTAALEPSGELALGLADMDLFEELDEAWCDKIAEDLERFPLWVVDANLPAATLQRLLNTYGGDATVIADPVSVAKAARMRPVLDAIDVIVPNRMEAQALSGCPVETTDEVALAAAAIWDEGPGTVIVSLGAQGVYLNDGTRKEYLPPIPAQDVRDVTGAGDALIAGYVYGVLHDHSDPVRSGLAAASLALEVNGGRIARLSPDSLKARSR